MKTPNIPVKSIDILKPYGKIVLQNHIKNYTLVNSPLQNIIPIVKSNKWIPNNENVYIIAFADNGNATA